MTKKLFTTLALCTLSACLASEPPDTGTEAQELGARCSLQRPFAWSGATAYCVESLANKGTSILLDGQRVQLYAVPYVGRGIGEVTVICTDGLLSQDPSDTICIPNRGGGDPF